MLDVQKTETLTTMKGEGGKHETYISKFTMRRFAEQKVWLLPLIVTLIAKNCKSVHKKPVLNIIKCEGLAIFTVYA